MDLLTLIKKLSADGTLDNVIGNPLAQFGPPQRPLLGATLLPERQVTQNHYEEAQIRYRTVIANDGGRYSPAQLKSGGQIVGEFLVSLGNQDIAVQMGPNDYEAIGLLLKRNIEMDAASTMINWFDRSIVQALAQVTEKARWQAIVAAKVERRGDNGFKEDVAYPDPSGHRAAAGDDWTDNTYDPFDDIYAMIDLLKGKGYTVNRLISSSKVKSILTRNAMVVRRIAPVRVLSDGNIFGRLTAGDLDSYLMSDNLPPIETYDESYFDLTGITSRYLPDDVLVFICTTGRDDTFIFGDTSRYLPNILGYTAIGVPVGRDVPGRTYHIATFDDKPPRIEAEGWQTSLPVITEPESIGVIKGIQ